METKKESGERASAGEKRSCGKENKPLFDVRDLLSNQPVGERADKQENALAVVKAESDEPSPRKEDTRNAKLARNYWINTSELAGDDVSVPVRVKTEPMEEPSVAYAVQAGPVPAPAPKKKFTFPGTRTWKHDRIRDLVDRACESGVRGVDGTVESVAKQRLVRSASKWLEATSTFDGVRADMVPMGGPKPPCNRGNVQRRFIDWNLPKDCTLSLARKCGDPGLEFRFGDPLHLQGLGFSAKCENVFYNIPRPLRLWQKFALQCQRVSVYQAVAVEDLLRRLHDLLGDTEQYAALLPAAEDVADLTGLVCNRAAASSHAVCRETRRAITDVAGLSYKLTNRLLQAPFSTTLFDGRARSRSPRRRPRTSSKDDDGGRRRSRSLTSSGGGGRRRDGRSRSPVRRDMRAGNFSPNRDWTSVRDGRGSRGGDERRHDSGLGSRDSRESSRRRSSAGGDGGHEVAARGRVADGDGGSQSGRRSGNVARGGLFDPNMFTRVLDVLNKRDLTKP